MFVVLCIKFYALETTVLFRFAPVTLSASKQTDLYRNPSKTEKLWKSTCWKYGHFRRGKISTKILGPNSSETTIGPIYKHNVHCRWTISHIFAIFIIVHINSIRFGKLRREKWSWPSIYYWCHQFSILHSLFVESNANVRFVQNIGNENRWTYVGLWIFVQVHCD